MQKKAKLAATVNMGHKINQIIQPLIYHTEIPRCPSKIYGKKNTKHVSLCASEVVLFTWLGTVCG